MINIRTMKSIEANDETPNSKKAAEMSSSVMEQLSKLFDVEITVNKDYSYIERKSM